MDLTIQVERYQDDAVSNSVVVLFSQEGGTIGRGSDNRLVLPDPLRHVSRVQAAVKWEANQFLLENISSANAFFVNDGAVEPGQRVVLSGGDAIKIGLYLLRVGSRESRQISASRNLPGPAAGVGSPDPFAGLFGDTAGSKVSGDHSDAIGHRIPVREAPKAGAAAQSSPDQMPDPFAPVQAPLRGAPIRQPKSAGSALIPEDFDPFAEPIKPRAANHDLLPSGGEINWSSIDDFLSPAANRELLHDLKPARVPLAPVDDSLALNLAGTLDPLALFGGEGSAAGHVALGDTAPHYLDHVSEIGSFFSPNPVEKKTHGEGASGNPTSVPEVFPSSLARQPEAPSRPVFPDAYGSKSAPASTAAPRMPAAEVHPASGDADPLIAAFARGAGLPPGVIKHTANAAFMETLGAMMHEATQGVVELLAARHMTKRELKAEVTMIGAVDNNPFKFLPNAESVLAQMFGPKLPGFAPPVVAMRDAWIDLRTHQLAVMAGMRAALVAVLGRFEPKTLAARVAPAGLDVILPGRRNTRLWEEFVRLYDDIQAEAEDQFETAFGDAFLAAYQNEIERLGRESFQAREF
jgi:FHA domain-containing protein